MKLPVHFETPVAVQVALEVPPVCQLVGRALTAARTAQPAWAATTNDAVTTDAVMLCA